MYPEENLGPAKVRLTLFLEQYWGGPTTYSEQRGHPRLRMRHNPFKVNPDARDRWLASADAQAAAFAACDGTARVRWVAGDLAARTLATTRLTETWIHTVDVAVAFGPAPAATDRLWHTARLAWRTVPYALGQQGIDAAGPVAFVLEAPDGATWTFGEPAAGQPMPRVRCSVHRSGAILMLRRPPSSRRSLARRATTRRP